MLRRIMGVVKVRGSAQQGAAGVEITCEGLWLRGAHHYEGLRAAVVDSGSAAKSQAKPPTRKGAPDARLSKPKAANRHAAPRRTEKGRSVPGRPSDRRDGDADRRDMPIAARRVGGSATTRDGVTNGGAAGRTSIRARKTPARARAIPQLIEPW